VKTLSDVCTGSVASFRRESAAASMPMKTGLWSCPGCRHKTILLRTSLARPQRRSGWSAGATAWRQRDDYRRPCQSGEESVPLASGQRGDLPESDQPSRGVLDQTASRGALMTGPSLFCVFFRASASGGSQAIVAPRGCCSWRTDGCRPWAGGCGRSRSLGLAHVLPFDWACWPPAWLDPHSLLEQAPRTAGRTLESLVHSSSAAGLTAPWHAARSRRLAGTGPSGCTARPPPFQLPLWGGFSLGGSEP